MIKMGCQGRCFKPKRNRMTKRMKDFFLSSVMLTCHKNHHNAVIILQLKSIYKKRKEDKQHHGFSRGKLKPYFKSPDNKINRQLPSWRHCLQLTKATVSTACLVRPPHSLIVLTVRFSVHIYSLTFFVLNLHMVITSCTPPKKSPLSGYASTKNR